MKTIDTNKSATRLPVKPDWIRIPREGAPCPHCGLYRRVMINLAVPCRANNHNPPVKSVLVKNPGCVTGTRLVHYPSLLAYLQREAEKQLKDARSKDVEAA